MQDHQKESKRGHQDIQPIYHTRNDHGIKQPEESPANEEARPRQTDHTPGKQSREIHDQDKIIERIEELYTELYDREQNTVIHTDPKDVPEIISWEVEAALRDMKNTTATSNDHTHRDIESRRRYHLEDTCQAVH